MNANVEYIPHTVFTEYISRKKIKISGFAFHTARPWVMGFLVPKMYSETALYEVIKAA